jgi:hypothetical protein
MVKQENPGKGSSAAPKGIAREMFDRLPAKEKWRARKAGFNWLLNSLLTDLANLHDRGHAKFWGWRGGLRETMFGRETDAALLELRDQLRQVWDRQTPVEEKDRILLGWLRPGSTWKESTIVPRFAFGTIIPNPLHLRAQLAFSVVSRARRLARCHNPECPTPYFLGRRRDQKFCERGDCTAYAQRQYALNWWKRERGSKGKNRRKRP